MRSIKTLVCSLLLLLPTGCIATEGGGTQLSLPALHAHLEAATLTLGDMATATKDIDPKMAGQLEAITQMVDTLDNQIEAVIKTGGGQLDAIQAIDLFLETTSSLVNATSDNPETQAKVRITVIAIRAIMIQTRIALAQ